MDITAAAIHKKRITIVALVIVAVSGLMTYRTMPRAEDPGFTIRVALIQTIFPGASPERVEQLVTDKLEKRIQEMPEIDFIASQSKPGISLIYVNIKQSYKNLRPIWDSLRRKVDAARGDLPSDVRGPFVDDEFGDVFGTVITLTGEGYTYAEMKEIADVCRNELLLIEQSAKVEIVGEQRERIFVEFNNSRLAELGMSPGQLVRILEKRNIVFPGGEVFTSDEQIALEPSGNFESVDELRQTIIQIPGSRDVVYLRDVAYVSRGYVDPPESKVHYNGRPALMLAVSLREGGNIIDLGDAVREKIARFQSVYPIGVDFDVMYFQPYFVHRKIQDFARNLMQAIILVVVVMLVSLGLRTGLVVASLIPMAILATLMIMGFVNIGLDQMSLAALIIALGMLVDNAIVMSESILVLMKEGKEPVRAAIESARELRIPLLISSLTTSVAFLPIFLAESDVGEYTASIFKVVTIALLASWVLSLTMMPLLCTIFLRVKKTQGEQTYDTRFYRLYRRVLLLGLRRPWLTLLLLVAVFVGSMQLTPYIPAIFFPANDKPFMEATLRLPVGTPLEKTERMVKEIENFIESEMMAEFDSDGSVITHGVIAYTSFIGAGGPRYILSYNTEPPAPEYAYILMELTDRWRIEGDFAPRLDAFCRENYPDLTANIAPLPLGPPVEAPVQIRVSGTVEDEVFAKVDRVKAILAGTPGTRDISDNWGIRTKKLFVRINQPRAQRAGLTNEDIAISLQSILSGITTTDYREEDEVIPIVVRSVGSDRHDLGKIESLNIYAQATGRSVPLKQVADVEVVFQPSKIWRRDRLKTVTVNAWLDPGYNAIAVAGAVDAELAPEAATWPLGYKYELGGEIESSGEANASINAKLPIAALLIVLLLVGQFDSLRRPIIILLTIPFGLTGVIIGLLVTQQPLGFVAFLGVIALAGIVINNAIVLLDRIKIEQDVNGLEPRRAVIEACQRRLRPILLTTATTVGGLIPLWLGGGPMFEAMAVAIIFGLIFATVLTLGLVPALYSLFFRVRFGNYDYDRRG